MKVRTITLVLAMLAVSVGLRAQQDPLMGTWKLNLAKSKFSPGPPPKSLIAKFEPSGNNGLELTYDEVDAQGNSTRGHYTANYDGKDYPYTGNPDADVLSMKRIDASTTDAMWKKAGKATITSRRAVSKDGKTLTTTQTGKNAKGQTVNNVMVSDKQ